MKPVSEKKWKALKIRQVVLQATRRFFEERGFLEIEIPVANRSIPLEPTIYPFVTKWTPGTREETFYLSASPEKTLKRYLAAGVENCYGIGHCFRNLEGAGDRHTPEFMMLEWYRTDANYQQIMQDVQELFKEVKWAVDRHLGREKSMILEYQGMKIDLSRWQIYSGEDLLKERADLELSKILTEEKMQEAALKKGYQIANATWEQLYNQIFLNEVESEFTEQPFFLTEFPAQISPLCEVNAEKPYLADRFEFYLGGMEIGNGNNEGLSAEIMRQYFKNEQKQRLEDGEMAQPIDEDFLQNIELMAASGCCFAGIGVGFDRLVMLMSDIADICEVGFDL